MMAKGFRLRGSKNPGNFAGLPPLPEDVDDNLYLASAAHAAVTDFNSGAYDEFLFSEHGMNKMPFEDSVDNHLDLVSLRLKDRGRRELLLKHQALLEAKARLAKLRASLETLQARLKSIKSKVSEQQSILDGKSPGKHGLIWPGSAPELTSKKQARLHLTLPALTFLLVGVVDLGIIILSLQSLDGFSGFEPIVFAIPAVAVQLVFPHFIGERIRLMLHGHPRKKVNALEAGTLAIGWMGFVWAMTQIRMNYISLQAAETGNSLSQAMRTSLQILMIAMLIALGTWLMLQTSRTNPHERELSRLQLAEREATENLQAATEKITGLEAEIPVLDLAVKVAEESYKDAVSAVGKTLAETAKSVYRRALVNQTGSVDFTTAYMGDRSTFTQSMDEEPQPAPEKGI